MSAPTPAIPSGKFPVLAKAAGGLLLLLGVTLLLTYVGKLLAGSGPLDDLAVVTNDFTYYLGATAGCGMLAWGTLLFRCNAYPVAQPAIALGSAAGFALLSGMRLLAFTNEQMRSVGGGLLIGEAIVFGGIAAVLLVFRPKTSAASEP